MKELEQKALELISGGGIEDFDFKCKDCGHTWKGLGSCPNCASLSIEGSGDEDGLGKITLSTKDLKFIPKSENDPQNLKIRLKFNVDIEPNIQE